MVHRRRRPYNRRQKRSMEFLWPFLIIIGVGVLVVLVVQFIFSWFGEREDDLRNQALFYVDSGSVRILPWGETDWTKAYHGQTILSGDVLLTGRSSRGVLTFYNGAVVRMDEQTKAGLNEIVVDRSEEEVSMTLREGDIWVNMDESSESIVTFVVETDYLRVTSYGDTFAMSIDENGTQTVRVVEGEVLLEVFELDGDREVILEQEKIGVGQQVEITNSVYQDIIARQPVYLLEAIDSGWEKSDWYGWNAQEDADPTDYSSDEAPSTSEISDDDLFDEEDFEEEDPETSLDGSEENDESDGEEDSEEGELFITITFPSGAEYDFNPGDSYVQLSGTTSSVTEIITVTSYDVYGNPYPYELQNYAAGSTEWRYNASWDLGNLYEGNNKFDVVAEDADGNKSAVVSVTIKVPYGTFAGQESTQESAEEDISVDESGGDVEIPQ